MKLIVITPSRDVEDEQSLVTKMFESGLQTLHLRKPKHSTNKMREYLDEIPEMFHNRIVIHSHHHLALKYKLKGIHLGRVHLSKKLRYVLIRWRLKLRFSKTHKSRSYSRLQQLHNKEEQKFDYVMLGTVYNNMTGELYSGLYESGLIGTLQTCGKSVIARGGTAILSIKKSLDFGFDGIAFNSFVWNAELPFDNFEKILAEFKRLNIEIE